MNSGFHYIIFNKPFDVLSSFTDPEGRSTLKMYIDFPGIYSAGRLDQDSEGLLILTDDGNFIHGLTDPRSHLPKTYLVQVEGIVTPEALAILEKGVLIQGKLTLPCQALAVPDPELPERSKPVTPHKPTSWLKIVLEEGRKRQIRHMTAAVGFPTLRVYRIAIGSLTLGDLQPGQWRFLTLEEEKVMRLAIRNHPRRNFARVSR
jgi:23S rRNA pseudouridine2457 synthase